MILVHLVIRRQRGNIMAWFCEHECKSPSKREYIYLSSEDSQDLYPDNNMTDFVVELPQTIHLDEGQWEMALMEANYDKDIHKDHGSLYLLCDICEYSIVRNNKQPILRKLMWHTSYRLLQHFMNIQHKKEIKRLHFRLVDVNLQPVVYTGSFYCTLLLQKKDL